MVHQAVDHGGSDDVIGEVKVMARGVPRLPPVAVLAAQRSCGGHVIGVGDRRVFGPAAVVAGHHGALAADDWRVPDTGSTRF